MIATIRHRLRLIYNAYFRERLIRIGASRPLFASLYYTVNPSFRREQRAVLVGKRNHMRGIRDKSGPGARFKLRRNIHRLEKGLIMRPRRDVFAKAYLPVTVQLYCESLQAQTDNPADRAVNTWAADVLHQYFEAVAPGLCEEIDAARAQFDQATATKSVCFTDVAPFLRDTEPLKTTIDDMLAMAIRRRSVRWYLDKPVEREKLDRAFEVAGYSPSACNRQPFRFHVIDDPETAQRVGSIPMGTTGFAQNFPCLIVVVGNFEAFEHERDRHVPYIDSSLASMALLFALESQGIGSCCINWPDVEALEQKMDKAINLRPHERPVMCISVGYPDPEGLVPRSQKVTLDEMRRYHTP